MRTVPALLQAHLNSGATTVTVLMRIEPAAPGYAVVGCTQLDRDVVYDDGAGEVTYAATTALTPSNLQSTASMGVDNGEFQHLLPEGDMGISEKDLNSGAYDFAKYKLYLVNYEDLTMGHVLIGSGTLGQIRVEDGLTFWTEATSTSKALKTQVTQKGSRTCRAIFGSQPLGTPGGVVTERFPCGKDLTDLWQAFEVEAVGLESNRMFTAADWTAPERTFVPGMLRWTAGANQGRSYEVEVQGATGNIELAFETMFPIQAGDTFEIRPDCTKWKDGANGCKSHFGDQWTLHYRGEPNMKPQDGNTVLVPGIAISSGVE